MSAAFPPITASLWVALGGSMGALGRFHVGRMVNHFTGPTNTFPWATLSVNVVGSLAMGALLGWLARGSVTPQTGESMRLLIGVGLLGGFTTFSTFSAELVTLFHRGQMLQGFAYGSISLIAGMAAFVIGLVLAQSIQ
jgi:CrcB protein